MGRMHEDGICPLYFSPLIFLSNLSFVNGLLMGKTVFVVRLQPYMIDNALYNNGVVGNSIMYYCNIVITF